MQIKIVDSRPWYDENKTTIGTVYTVCCEDENGTEFVEVNVRGDDDSLKEQFGKSYDVNTYGDAPDFAKIDDDGADRLKKRHATPPEAYAAFIRLYIEWMEMSEDEQIKFVEQNVRAAGKMHKKVTKSCEGIPFSESGHEMYGEDFVGYRDEAWASQLERFSDVDAFALYLEKNLMRYGKFPMSGDILRRAAQNMLETMRRQQIIHSEVLSYDSPVQEDDGSEIEVQIPDHSEALENIVTYQDFVSYIRSLLKNNVRVKVFDLLLDGYKQKEIAEMITVIDRNGEEKTISPAAVSKHVQRIRNLIDSVT